MYFRNYGLRKTWLDKYKKSAASDDASKRNMRNAPKHCSNPNGGSFSIFIDSCEDN